MHPTLYVFPLRVLRCRTERYKCRERMDAQERLSEVNDFQ